MESLLTFADWAARLTIVGGTSVAAYAIEGNEFLCRSNRDGFARAKPLHPFGTTLTDVDG
jgi:hypothetical protein